MKTLKLITTLVLALVFLFAQAGNVAAAPLAQAPASISGTVQSIVPEKDAAGAITVLVTLMDAQGNTQTVRISEATAKTLGLLQLDSAGNLILDQNGLPLAIVLDPNAPLSITIATGDIITDPAEEEPVHPISALLAAFFFPDDEGMGSVIDGYHDDGFGFGVIAQALWISQNLTGTDESIDTALTEAILDAKQDKDYENFFELYPQYLQNFDGTAPTNWGQFKKVLLEKKNNLGTVVSGHAEQDENPSQSLQSNVQDKGNGKGHGKDKVNGKGNGHGKGHNKP